MLQGRNQAFGTKENETMTDKKYNELWCEKRYLKGEVKEFLHDLKMIRLLGAGYYMYNSKDKIIKKMRSFLLQLNNVKKQMADLK